MTETTKTVFETYQVRKTKKQKAAFRAYVREVAERQGYEVHEERGSLGAVNLVVGDPTTASVTYTAHYDTCARLPLPNFITPTRIGVYLLYQLFLVVLMLCSAEVFRVGARHLVASLTEDRLAAVLVGQAVYVAVLFFEVYWIMAGAANPHTANDNTSGVTVVLDLMQALPHDLRGSTAFILFDLEEAGLLGSSGYASKHKAAMADRPLINFDCVSDGDTILIAPRKRAAGLADTLATAFPEQGKFHVSVKTNGVFYPSDQAAFPCGVAVAALKRSRRGLLYMDRIHTGRDTVYEEENIAYLVECSIRLSRLLGANETETR